MDLRYSVTDRSGEEKQVTFDHKLKYYFRFEGKSHHAGEYQNYYEYFAECLESGKTAFPDLQEGIGTIAVLKAMELSLETGLPVKVKEVLKAQGL
jgi:hypothetical protein